MSTQSKPRTTKIVQDGHSGTEESVYKALFNAGRDIGRDYRDVTISCRELAKRIAVHPVTVKRSLRSLERKLSIVKLRDEVPASGIPKTYRVYSYVTILQRRKEAGLTMVSRRHGYG